MVGDTFKQITPEPKDVLVAVSGFFIGALIGIAIGASLVVIWRLM